MLDFASIVKGVRREWREDKDGLGCFFALGGVLSADRRVDAIEVRCASFTQILALPDNHGTRGRGRVRGRLRLKNENDSWIDEEETSRKWGARWLVARSSQSFPNRTRPRTRARPYSWSGFT